MLKINRSNIFKQKTLTTIFDALDYRLKINNFSPDNKIVISGVREALYIVCEIPQFFRRNKGPSFRITKVKGKIQIKEYKFCKGCIKLDNNYLYIDDEKIKEYVEKEKTRIEKCLKNKNAFNFQMSLVNIRFQEWLENFENKKKQENTYDLIAVSTWGNINKAGANYIKEVDTNRYDIFERISTQDGYDIVIRSIRYNYEKALEKDLDDFRFKINCERSDINDIFWNLHLPKNSLANALNSKSLVTISPQPVFKSRKKYKKAYEEIAYCEFKNLTPTISKLIEKTKITTERYLNG